MTCTPYRHNKYIQHTTREVIFLCYTFSLYHTNEDTPESSKWTDLWITVQYIIYYCMSLLTSWVTFYIMVVVHDVLTKLSNVFD